ncbi:DUF3472 domain-containing protein [Aquimarina sp. 2201CG1-2-11]|uniref:DUF3472 domain-containing protein n=1 Tax=Aquimarina discodermiae TaxID=3231043 RepID=UPI00346303B8
MKLIKFKLLLSLLVCLTIITSCTQDNDFTSQPEFIEPGANDSKNLVDYPGDCDAIKEWDRFTRYRTGDKVKYRSNTSRPFYVYERAPRGWTNLGMCSDNTDNPDTNFTVAIATQGNSWVTGNPSATQQMVNANGINNWKDKSLTIRTYFYITKPGIYSLGIDAKVRSGNSELEATFGDQSKKIKLSNTNFQKIYLGELEVLKKGYYHLDLKAISKESSTYATIKNVLLGKDATSNTVKFVKNDIHFGRRGPSVHLGYVIPTNNNIQAFYNEVEVPKGQDVIGSYFMANGFQYGYFGIQVNSSTERRILFSVWSPFVTDNPGDIPEEDRIKLLKKGNGVITNQFGGEGSGGQSYKVFDWKSGIRYKFLLLGKPAGNNYTDFTAYFMDPTKGKWDLIASFRRPKTNAYLKNQYSFLENFITHTGDTERAANFYNQWVYDTGNRWHQITRARFTYDATAENEFRFDYSGGVSDDGFFLRNCGFFNDNTVKNTMFNRNDSSSEIPTINFSGLE